ncbi:hypothetical protein [Umezawaea sp. Da 62-37]|uniref:PPE domain-containing protein n=1 Tax=Umezawaea sp. Da 62-37 TaxID=3075927 RepID=UPI0028F7443F|nr:hypothetical protein [Umezawaea sp. Da 62-37]WNV82079.1 hypothetical protein RM788_28125 [Umezawaea sp. Da 62-37]
MIGEYNWDAWSHEDLHAMIHGRDPGLAGAVKGYTGRGVAGGAEAAEAWSRFTALMRGLQDRTTDALARAGVSWVGRAADAAGGGITPLAQWAGDAHTAGTATHGGTTALVDSYSAARDSMPEPVAAGSTNSDLLGIPAGFTHLLGGQTDQDQRERVAQAAKLEAVRILRDYREHSAATAADLGLFIPPPNVVTEIGVTNPARTPVGQPTGTPYDDPRRDGTTPGTPRLALVPPPSSPVDATAVDGTATAQASAVPTRPEAPPPPPPTASATPRTPDHPAGSPVAVATGSKPFTGRTTTASATTIIPNATIPNAASPNTAKPNAALPNTAGPGTGSRMAAGTTAGRPDTSGDRPVPRGGGAAALLTSPKTTGQPVPPTSARLQPGAGAVAAGPVAGPGSGSSAEDREHVTPDYLNGDHDEFWDPGPDGRIAPPVIGE